MSSTCDGVGQHRGSVAAVRNTVQFNIVACGIHQVRDGKVTHFTGQSELQRVRMLLGVTDPDNKAIKVARHGAPGQAEVMWAHR